MKIKSLKNWKMKKLRNPMVMMMMMMMMMMMTQYTHLIQTDILALTISHKPTAAQVALLR